MGMTEAEVVRTMGTDPTAVVRDRAGAIRLKRLMFRPSRLLPAVTATPVYVEVDADRDRAVRFVCREVFMRTDPLLGALEAGLVRTAADALTVLRQASQPLGRMGAGWLAQQERRLYRA
jgi:hypothetical protein